tara:strand:+ start:1595 stop:2125 length:531 start_codon:yes stop_codon:yes gene_type:complete
MSEQILFYSKNCSFCTELLNKLYKNKEILEKIILININNHQLQIPRYIKSVPSLLVNDKGNINVLTDNELFEWVDAEINKLRSSILDWDPTTMSGYSGAFSFIGDEDSKNDRNYTFLTNVKQYKINTPDADSINGSNDSNEGSKKRSNKENNDISNKLEMLKQQRDMETPKSTSRQ